VKDYSTNSNERRKYILSYTIENGKIIAKLASGNFYIIPYNEDNEQAVISKMEMQARLAENPPLNIYDKVLAILQPLFVPIAIVNFINYGGWFWGIALVITGITAIYWPVKCIKNLIKERDIRKLKYLLDNQQELNDNVEKSENILLDVSKKAVNKIKIEQNKENKPFGINNIDHYSLKDLRTLKENIEIINSFGFYENNSTESEEIVKKRVLSPDKK